MKRLIRYAYLVQKRWVVAPPEGDAMAFSMTAPSMTAPLRLAASSMKAPSMAITDQETLVQESATYEKISHEHPITQRLRNWLNKLLGRT